MKELSYIYEGLAGCNTMLMKVKGQELECSFIRKGIVQKVVQVKDQVLACALMHQGHNGILEGIELQVFRNTFYSFSLHVRAQNLLLELKFTLKRIDRHLEEVMAA